MHFKLIVVMVDENKTKKVLEAARATGATGATVLNQARGEGLEPRTTFFGLSLETRCDVVLLLVEEHLSRRILEAIAAVGGFDDTSGTGIAFQIDVEDAIGVGHQMRKLSQLVEDNI
ncbi:MAG: transcriptional regulator [Candidatus Contendobacter odensis]|uniref:Transcriptional regulator n=1 Tax=Candidatus Contendibacter odensensis TaxID=1400860 RepID=A0A2G6PG64_9GAMM|nr:MAG: transcriptional regulator [Candidatus Contendobacter odensis]